MAMLFFVVIFFTGVICVLANAIMQRNAKQPNTIYKYIPRDLDVAMREEANMPSLAYRQMFEEPSL
jgi:hypothetical protein